MLDDVDSNFEQIRVTSLFFQPISLDTVSNLKIGLWAFGHGGVVALCSWRLFVHWNVFDCILTKRIPIVLYFATIVYANLGSCKARTARLSFLTAQDVLSSSYAVSRDTLYGWVANGFFESNNMQGCSMLQRVSQKAKLVDGSYSWIYHKVSWSSKIPHYGEHYSIANTIRLILQAKQIFLNRPSFWFFLVSPLKH